MKNAIKGMAVALSLAMGLPALAAGPARREVRQQARVEQGERSGQLTRAEARRLEREQAQLDAKLRRQRARNGGRLTPAQRREAKREQDRLNRQIYREKHDRQTQPGVRPARW
jgi:hypothetical protein